MRLTATAGREVTQRLMSTASEQGLDREAPAASSVLRVRTRPECPENYLRGLTWDSNPNCGIAREKKRTFLRKALMRRLACSQNKGLSKSKGELAGCVQAAPPAGGREAARSIRAQGQGLLQSQPRPASSTKLCASRLPVANHIFLGSWTVDIRQEGRRLRSAPQRRHRARLRWCFYVHPESRGAGPGRGLRRTVHLGQRSLVTWAAQTWEGHKMHTQLSRALADYLKTWAAWTWEVHETQGPLWAAPLKSTLEPEQCRPRKHRPPWAGANPGGPYSASAAHTPAIFVCSSLPSTKHSWTSEPKEVTAFCPLVSGWKLDNEEACKGSQNKQHGTALEVTGTTD